jgi:predicted nuclease with TOPRIM domain
LYLSDLQQQLHSLVMQCDAAQSGQEAVAAQLTAATDQLKAKQDSLRVLQVERQQLTEQLAQLHKEDGEIRQKLNLER